MAKRNKRKRRAPSAAEEKDHDALDTSLGRPFERRVETKMGADGVEETHVSYHNWKPKSFSIPNEKYRKGWDKIFGRKK